MKPGDYLERFTRAFLGPEPDEAKARQAGVETLAPLEPKVAASAADAFELHEHDDAAHMLGSIIDAATEHALRHDCTDAQAAAYLTESNADRANPRTDAMKARRKVKARVVEALLSAPWWNAEPLPPLTDTSLDGVRRWLETVSALQGLPFPETAMTGPNANPAKFWAERRGTSRQNEVERLERVQLRWLDCIMRDAFARSMHALTRPGDRYELPRPPRKPGRFAHLPWRWEARHRATVDAYDKAVADGLVTFTTTVEELGTFTLPVDAP